MKKNFYCFIFLFFILPAYLPAQRCPKGYEGRNFSEEIMKAYKKEIISVSFCKQVKGSEVIQKVFFTIKNNTDTTLKVWLRFAIDCKDAHREYVGGDSMLKSLPPREEISGNGDNADVTLYREIKKDVSPEADKIDEISIEIFSISKVVNGKTELIPSLGEVIIKVPPKDTLVVPVALHSIRSKSNTLSIYFSGGKVLGNAAEEDSTNNFPLGIGLGGNLQFQHFFADTSFAFYLHAGLLIWQSEGKVFWDGTGENDSVTGTIIKSKLTAIPIQAGLKFYKKYFYGFIEAGIYFTNKTGSATNNGTDENFLLPTEDVLGKKTSFSFAPGIGYEIKLDKKSFLDVNFRYQDILYPEQSIGFIGFRAGYNLLF